MNKSIQRGRGIMRHKKPPQYGETSGDGLLQKQGVMLDQDETTETEYTPVIDGIESDTVN